MENQIDFDLLKRLANGLANQFGKNCEVVVHDLSRNYEKTIIHIENGHVSGRKIGDGASEVVIKALYNEEEAEDKYGYFTRTSDGRELKSTSIIVRNKNGHPAAVFSINFDISELRLAENIIKDLTDISSNDVKEDPETIPNNVNNLLDLLIEEAYQLVGKPVNMMTKEDKMKAIRYLEQRGALLIKKSGDKISRFFDISKYTLYGYLSSEDEN